MSRKKQHKSKKGIQTNNVTSVSIISTEQNAISPVVVIDLTELDNEPTNIDLNAGAVGKGFIPCIRMDHVQKDESVSYVSYKPSTGEVCPISPIAIGKTTKVKKALFAETILLSPNSGNPLKLSRIQATTPQGKNKLRPDAVISNIFTPIGKTQHQVLRLRGEDDSQTSCDIKNVKKMQKFKTQFDLAIAADKGQLDKSSPPEFRGGSTLLTAADVKYRSSKNKQTGGHRSLFSKPGQVMRESAKDAANELGLVTKTCARWDWGHLLPAGGTAQGIEVNLDPYNFLAVPATLNTWQMVPEMMARHLAQLGFEVEYTALARAELNSEGDKYSFVAKEIYSSVKLRHHGLKAEFFTTREDHAKPLITDAVYALGNFYKIAGKPVPSDLKEKFEKELAESLEERKKLYAPECFITPEKQIEPGKQYAFLEQNKSLIFSPMLSVREGFNEIKRPKKSKKPMPIFSLDGLNDDDDYFDQEDEAPKKRILIEIYDDEVDEVKEESIAKRTRSKSKLKK